MRKISFYPISDCLTFSVMIEPQPLIVLKECLGWGGVGVTALLQHLLIVTVMPSALMCERKGQRDLHYAVQMLISRRACQ